MSAMMSLAKLRAAMVVGDFDFTNNGAPLTALPAILTALNATYTRNSLKNVPQNGALVSLSANQFGTSYDPVAGQYGYVPEPAATNLATYSDGTTANLTTSVNLSNGTAVPGFTNGIAFGDNSVTRTCYKTVTLSSATAYTISIFVIMDDGTAPVVGTTSSTGDFSLVVNGNLVASAALVRLIGSNVYRVSASYTTVSTDGRIGLLKYTTQSARTFRITGMMFETGLRATSYIATTGSTASRSADVLTVPLWINNVKDSQDCSTANWTRANCAVSTDGTTAPNGGLAQLITVSAPSANIGNTSTKAPSTVVTVTVYIKQGNKATAAVMFRNQTTATNFQQGILTFATGTITGAGWAATGAGGGWFKCVFTQSTGITVGDALWIYVLTSGVSVVNGDTQYVGGVQIEPGAVATAYRPTVNNLEYARNRFSFSENFGNSAWSKTNTTVTEDAAASPNGNVTADKLIVNAAATLGNSYTGRTYTKSAEAQTHTVSVRAKIGEYNKLILYVAGASTSDSCQMTANLSTGAVVASSQTGTFTKLGQTCTSAGNGYYLLTLSFTTNTDTSLQVRLYPTDTVATTGDGTSGVYIFGAQLNNGSAATEYEPTDTVTPSANANITGFSSAGYTLAVDQRMDTTLAASTVALELSDLTTANRPLLVASGGTTANISVATASVSQVNTSFGALGLTRKKMSASVSQNNVLSSLSGTAGTPDTSATMPTGLVMLHIATAFNFSLPYNGFIFNAKLIPQALTQAQINGLTT